MSTNLGGVPLSFNPKWEYITQNKYDREYLHPDLRATNNTVVISSGVRNIDATNLPDDKVHNKGQHLTQADIRLLTPNTGLHLDPTRLRPYDNPFLSLLPYGSRTYTTKSLDSASDAFLTRSGMTDLKPGPPSQLVNSGGSAPGMTATLHPKDHDTRDYQPLNMKIHQIYDSNPVQIIMLGGGTYLVLSKRSAYLGAAMAVLSIAQMKTT